MCKIDRIYTALSRYTVAIYFISPGGELEEAFAQWGKPDTGLTHGALAIFQLPINS